MQLAWRISHSTGCSSSGAKVRGLRSTSNTLGNFSSRKGLMSLWRICTTMGLMPASKMDLSSHGRWWEQSLLAGGFRNTPSSSILRNTVSICAATAAGCLRKKNGSLINATHSSIWSSMLLSVDCIAPYGPRLLYTTQTKASL